MTREWRLTVFLSRLRPSQMKLRRARLAWLDRALWQGFGSAGAEQCIPLEVVDGFFTGMLSGPEPRPSFEGVLPGLLPQVGEVFSRPEVRREVREALRQLFDTLESCLSRGIPPEPWITDTGLVKRGELWVMGFMRAMTLDKAGWEPLLNHRVAEQLLAPASWHWRYIRSGAVVHLSGCCARRMSAVTSRVHAARGRNSRGAAVRKHPGKGSGFTNR